MNVLNVRFQVGMGSGICLRVRVGFDFMGYMLLPRVSGFRAPDFITSSHTTGKDENGKWKREKNEGMKNYICDKNHVF